MVAQMFSLQELFFEDNHYTDPKLTRFSDASFWEGLVDGALSVDEGRLAQALAAQRAAHEGGESSTGTEAHQSNCEILESLSEEGYAVSAAPSGAGMLCAKLQVGLAALRAVSTARRIVLSLTPPAL